MGWGGGAGGHSKCVGGGGCKSPHPLGREQWTVGSGQWTAGSGQSTVDNRPWAMGSGQWAVDNGQ